jgi:uncharacterized protein YjbI with pentapeptide repeats
MFPAMANADHLKILRQGVDTWNLLRMNNDAAVGRPDFSRANLRGANLFRADLGGANLCEADLRDAELSAANLLDANLIKADLRGAGLYRALLRYADFRDANLQGADLRQVDLCGANLRWAKLDGAKLSGANLNYANLVEADFTDADLTNCWVYGISAWGLKLNEGTKQQNLLITRTEEPQITADDIEVAQFLYLLLNNEKIRSVIDTITSKAVLILGRFTAERKAVLDNLRDELRKLDYLPMLFDFDKPAHKDLTGTVSTLAHMARFIIADGTDPKSIPYELATIVPTTVVPVQPILLSGKREFSMFPDLQRRYHWVLPTHHYDNQQQLIADLRECVIRPAEDKAAVLRRS